ncbi:MAG: hypothetical protein ACI4VN_04035 [Clostridia bacterium]|nr:hypothetical protein [Clostridia bacterium]
MYNFPKIQFGEKDFYVVDFFEYEGVKYYYIYEDVYEEGMDISKFDGDIEINFIFKREDGKYENVVDDNLFKKLLNLASKRLVLNQNKYFNAEDSKK